MLISFVPSVCNSKHRHILKYVKYMFLTMKEILSLFCDCVGIFG